MPDDHLGADEAALQVGVDHAGALGRGRAGAERPRAGLLVARREERARARAGAARRGRAGARRSRRRRGRRAARRAPLPAAATTSGSPSSSTHTARASSPNGAASASASPSWSTPMFTTTSAGLFVSRNTGASSGALVVAEGAAVDRLAVGQRGLGALERRDLGGEALVALGRPALLVETLSRPSRGRRGSAPPRAPPARARARVRRRRAPRA